MNYGTGVDGMYTEKEYDILIRLKDGQECHQKPTWSCSDCPVMGACRYASYGQQTRDDLQEVARDLLAELLDIPTQNKRLWR